MHYLNARFKKKNSTTQYESTMLSFSEAKLACENAGAKLASVHTPNDLATIQYFLDRNRLAFWIGLKKVGGTTYCVNQDCSGMLRYDKGSNVGMGYG